MTVRNDIGGTAEAPCVGALFGMIKACSRAELESWIRAGDSLAADFEAGLQGQLAPIKLQATAWLAQWAAVKAQVVMPPFNANEPLPGIGHGGVGIVTTVGDADARAMAGVIAQGIEILRVANLLGASPTASVILQAAAGSNPRDQANRAIGLLIVGLGIGLGAYFLGARYGST